MNPTHPTPPPDPNLREELRQEVAPLAGNEGHLVLAQLRENPHNRRATNLRVIANAEAGCVEGGAGCIFGYGKGRYALVMIWL